VRQDIKPIKEEMNKVIELDHELNKRTLMIQVMVSFNGHKYDILNKTPSLKGFGIF